MSGATSLKHFDNERVIVTGWRFTPGARTGWHRHAHDDVIEASDHAFLEVEIR